MLARVQKVISISIALAALAWGVYFGATGRPFWGAGGALVILLGYALFLGAEFALVYFLQTSDMVPRPTLGQLLSAWGGETLVAPRVFLWRQPFRSNVEPDRLPAGCEGQRGVLLVHGFVCNRGLWNPWMRELRRRGVPFVALNLEPLFGSIDRYAEHIESAMARIESATAMPVVLVGHSMGGIAIRQWLARYRADARVHRVITIGSPHQGTWLARYARTLNGREMRIASPWLAQLAAQEVPARCGLFTCFFGHCDNIVFPAAAGTLRGADNIHVPATAHVQMAFRAQVFEEVCRWQRS
jgi:triacylglycerol lipase